MSTPLMALRGAMQFLEAHFYAHTDIVIHENDTPNVARFSYHDNRHTLTMTLNDGVTPSLSLRFTALSAQSIELITGALVDVTKQQPGTSCQADEENDAITLTVTQPIPELKVLCTLCLTGKMVFDGPKNDSAPVALTTLCRPEWYQQADFLAWLNDPNNAVMTFHSKGSAPTEFSDIVVWVDPSLNGEGDSPLMPEPYWREVVRAAAKTNGQAEQPETGHYPVRILNIES